MCLRTTMTALAVFMLLFGSGPNSYLTAAQGDATSTCTVSKPNGNTPPGERPSPNHHGVEGLWTVLWDDGTVRFEPGGSGFVLEDGALKMKFPWWRGRKGKLTITGRRLDADAPPMRSDVASGYGDTGFQATYMIFPTVGCWEVTGRVGDVSLTFVVRVVYLGNPRDPKGGRIAPPN